MSEHLLFLPILNVEKRRQFAFPNCHQFTYYTPPVVRPPPHFRKWHLHRILRGLRLQTRPAAGAAFLRRAISPRARASTPRPSSSLAMRNTRASRRRSSASTHSNGEAGWRSPSVVSAACLITGGRRMSAICATLIQGPSISSRSCPLLRAKNSLSAMRDRALCGSAMSTVTLRKATTTAWMYYLARR